jgi:uncharacterized protein (TIGR00369 family)
MSMGIPITFEQLEQAGWRRHVQKGFTGLIGPLWSRRSHDAISFGILTNKSHLNPAGLVHGGFLATMLDQTLSTIGWEAAGRLPCVTIQLEVQFLSAIKPGTFIEARGEVVKQSRAIVFMQGDLWIAAERVATGNAVLKIVQSPTVDSARRNDVDD